MHRPPTVHRSWCLGPPHISQKKSGIPARMKSNYFVLHTSTYHQIRTPSMLQLEPRQQQQQQQQQPNGEVSETESISSHHPSYLVRRGSNGDRPANTVDLSHSVNRYLERRDREGQSMCRFLKCVRGVFTRRFELRCSQALTAAG